MLVVYKGSAFIGIALFQSLFIMIIYPIWYNCQYLSYFCIIREDGSCYEHPHWFELAKDKWAQVYKTTGTPCSCWMCRGEEYDRKGYKQEILRITKESEY